MNIKFRKNNGDIGHLYVDAAVANRHRLDEDTIYSLEAYFIIQQDQLEYEKNLSEFLTAYDPVDNTLDRWIAK